jgi:tetratricopeptide (TPR) repeat protein
MIANKFFKIAAISIGFLVAGCNQVKPDSKPLVTKDVPADAMALILTKQNAKAKKILGKFVKTIPNDWAARKETAEKVSIVYWNQEHRAQCFAFDTANTKKTVEANLGNSYSQAFYVLGYIANEEGDAPGAIQYLDKALTLEPNNPIIISERAAGMLDGTKLEEKLALFERALDKNNCISDSDKARTLRGKGVTLIDMERLDEAEKALYESLKFDPKNAIAINELDYIDKLRNGAQKQKLQLINGVNK